ncbi:MAG: TrmH family RNA methyltransferase [Vicinamibacterales bacterium]
MRAISSRQNPAVRAFRELARTPDPTGARLLLDGVHLIRNAMAAGTALEAIAVSASRAAARDEADIVRAAAAHGTPVFTVATQAFAAMSPVRAPSGVVAIAHRTPVDAHSICRRPDGFVLIAADIQDPGNLGSLIRAGEAGGVSGVLVCGASASPFSWKAVRGSMGSILRLPVAAGLAVDAAMRCIRAQNGRVVAAVPRQGRDPDAVNWRGRVALLVGGEGPGLSEATLGQVDDAVTIPMSSPVESLNVAVAAAILVYAARRQRT